MEFDLPIGGGTFSLSAPSLFLSLKTRRSRYRTPRTVLKSRDRVGRPTRLL
jgi:hypothetical protein